MTHDHLFADLARQLDGARSLVMRHPPEGDSRAAQSMVDAIDCARVVMLQLASLSREHAVPVEFDAPAKD